jgi:porin
MSTTTRFAVILLALITWCTAVQAGAPQTFSDDLVVDWNGIRNYLLENGIDFRVGYVSETATNAQGGDKELWRYSDQWTFATTLDLQELLGINQAQFKFTITDRDGRDLSADANLGSLQQVQEIYGRGQTWRWTQFWYDQKYLDGMLDWKVGRLDPGLDFAAFSCEFMNLTFCGSTPGNIVGSYWYNWPVSQWGTRLKVLFSDFGYVQLGAYEDNPRYLLTRNTLDLGEPGGATGALVAFEVGWQPRFGDRLDGSYKLGAWYNSSKAPDIADNTNGQPLALDGGQPLIHNGQYGAYVNFLQRLTPPSFAGSKRGVSVFFNATFADRQTATLDNQIATGAFYTGPFALRPADEIGFAVGRTHVNSRIAAVESQQNAAGLGPVGVQSSEYAAEIFYSVHAANWLELRPNIQYVHQPGGIAQNTDDVIVGLRLSVNF